MRTNCRGVFLIIIHNRYYDSPTTIGGDVDHNSVGLGRSIFVLEVPCVAAMKWTNPRRNGRAVSRECNRRIDPAS